MWYKVGMKQVGVNAQLIHNVLSRFAENELMLLDLNELQKTPIWYNVENTCLATTVHSVLCGVLDE